VPALDEVEVNFLLAAWVFLLLLGMSAAVIGAYPLPPEETER
jgi:hypothetical protein